MTDKVHDAVIVGSGAAGAFAAQVLTARGLDVVMLEAGRTLGPADFDPTRKVGAKRGLNILERAEATLMGQPVQARAVFFRKWQAHLFINDRRTPIPPRRMRRSCGSGRASAAGGCTAMAGC